MSRRSKFRARIGAGCLAALVAVGAGAVGMRNAYAGSVHRETTIEASLEMVWEIVRDVGAPQRLAPGMVTDARLEDGARVVTFADGSTVRELIVSIDDARHRIAYAAVGGRAQHHNASLEVVAEDPNRCRIIWITDILPDTLVPLVTQRMEQGLAIAKRNLEAAAQPR